MRHTAERLVTFRRELRQAARSLLRAPTFSAIAFMTLALGIGATIGIYTVLETIVLRPLPYRAPNELVAVMHPTTVPGTGESRWALSAAGYFYFRQSNRTLSDLGAFNTDYATIYGDAADAERVQAGYVTASLMNVLQARPALGRLFVPDDDTPAAAPVVVLSHELWTRRYGADPRIVGKSIRTSAGTALVIGVAERGFTLPMPGVFGNKNDVAGFRVDLWQPLRLDPKALPQNAHEFTGIGRLRPGVTAEVAQRDLQALTNRFTELFPSAYSKSFIQQYQFRTTVNPLRDEVLGGQLVRVLWILFGATGLVLVIACANVANLFLVRTEARRREVAIRTALGASRGRLGIHHLAESLLLTTSAAIAGTLLAAGGTRTLVRLAPSDTPRLAEVAMHWTSIAAAVAIAIGAGVVFAVFPIVRARVDVDTLREGGRGLTPSRRQRTIRNALVIGQTALALMLLSAAGLMIRSFEKLRAVRPGLDPASTLVFSVALLADRDATYARTAAFHRELASRLSRLPGVKHVGVGSALPLRDFTGCATVRREGRPYGPNEKWPCVASVIAAPGYFEALGIPVVGRTPTWTDLDAATGAAVITRALADRLWPGEDPIGKGINNGSGKAFFRIVGVVPELHAVSLERAPTEAAFYPIAPIPNTYLWQPLTSATYVVRTSGIDPTSLTGAVRRIVAQIDPRVALAQVTTMEAVVAQSMARATFVMTLLAMASLMALLLSAVGIYGVISYVVGQRRAEIGVRMALGARVEEVAGRVVLQSLKLAGTGALIGLLGAVALTRLMRAILFGVSPTDPVVLVIVPIILLAIAALASFAPARRAARIDPAEALRS